MEAGKKVVDSPLHLADFGAALTSADSQQMQAVLECQEVWLWVGFWVGFTAKCPLLDSRATDDDIGTPEEGIGGGHTPAETRERGTDLVKGHSMNKPLCIGILQVEEKVNKMQRRYFLQEQLKIIKRELGLEVMNHHL